MEIKKLSEPELKALALRKNAQGCATAAALKAQAILYERLHWPSYNELLSRGLDRDGNHYTKQKRVNNETLADGVIFRRASEMEG